jgi:acyl-CoA reductase-like NAD-dependent aldehyde dehydrogenase
MDSIIQSFVPGYAIGPGEGGLDLVCPQDGRVIGRIIEAGYPGVSAAIQSAKAAFATHRKSPVHQRVQWLKAAAQALRDNAERVAALISEDIGKPMRAARFEAQRGADFIDVCAAAITQMTGEVLPLDAAQAGAGLFGFVRRVPYGVVAAITPFNAPVNLLIQKLAPAIAAGNAVVVKPAPAGTRVALRLAELFVKAGWPEGLFNVVTGDRETAVALVIHPDVRAVSFTGGSAAGDALAKAAGAKKFLAELGSNAANIILADADLPMAATKIASAGFEASGQQCISAQRILVQRDVLEPFLELLVAAAQKLKVGRADDPSADLGPMVSTAAADRVSGMIDDAVAKGAKLALAPSRDGATLSPAILVNVSRATRLWSEEVFGPVVVVVPFGTIAEALTLANDSPYGLQGAVFTRSLANAMRFSDEFDVGSLWVNEASRFRLDMYPFGGVKQSGVGREGVRYAIEELSQIKFTGIRPGVEAA